MTAEGGSWASENTYAPHAIQVTVNLSEAAFGQDLYLLGFENSVRLEDVEGSAFRRVTNMDSANLLNTITLEIKDGNTKSITCGISESRPWYWVLSFDEAGTKVIGLCSGNSGRSSTFTLTVTDSGISVSGESSGASTQYRFSISYLQSAEYIFFYPTTYTRVSAASSNAYPKDGIGGG